MLAVGVRLDVIVSVALVDCDAIADGERLAVPASDGLVDGEGETAAVPLADTSCKKRSSVPS